MNKGEPSSRWQDFIVEDTCFHKLSWREKYAETDHNGNETVYAKLIIWKGNGMSTIKAGLNRIKTNVKYFEG